MSNLPTNLAQRCGGVGYELMERGTAGRMGTSREPIYMGALRYMRKNSLARMTAGAIVIDRVARNYVEAFRGDLVGGTGFACKSGRKFTFSAGAPVVITTSKTSLQGALEQVNAVPTSDYSYFVPELGKPKLDFTAYGQSRMGCKEANINSALSKTTRYGAAVSTPSAWAFTQGDSGRWPRS